MYDFDESSDAAAAGPPRALLFLEFPRWLGEYTASRAGDLLIPPRETGQGRPVLVLPGFSADDAMTGRLRGHLKHQGFRVHGWQQGRNIGLTDRKIDGLVTRFGEIAAQYDEPVSVVGWSFGGLLARWLAHTHPDQVRQVICLGSPWRAEGERTRATAMFERSRRKHGVSERARDIIDELRGPVPVPVTAIWSRTDGIVPWRGCRVDESRDPIAENVEVPSSHVGMVANPLVQAAVVDRLSQDLDDWQPFGWRRALAGRLRGQQPLLQAVGK
ncbi:alpha/beta fold hydrolase [Nocardioides limicola]|uniref:alpha/beta fold hydrolase n=1 Tax=Nocardioides limicola TaxID=2803368 RepID=UPI00193AFCBA|nr:alpha/beta hydrolase [Nocardioides sp. DJM-14]